LASTPTAPPVKLRSPFNGEVWTVPPECAPDFVAALELRGFTRVEDVPTKTRKEARA